MRGTGFAQLVGVGALLAAAGCSGSDGTDPNTPQGSLRVIHAAGSAAALDVLVDGSVAINGLAAGTVSSPVGVPSGSAPSLSARPAGP